MSVIVLTEVVCKWHIACREYFEGQAICLKGLKWPVSTWNVDASMCFSSICHFTLDLFQLPDQLQSCVHRQQWPPIASGAVIGSECFVFSPAPLLLGNHPSMTQCYIDAAYQYTPMAM